MAQLLDDTASEAVKSSLRWELLNSSADAMYKQVTPGTLPPDGWSLSVGLRAGELWNSPLDTLLSL